MSIKPVCDNCGNELEEFGGLLFSPPDKTGQTKKWHLCKACYEQVIVRFK